MATTAAAKKAPVKRPSAAKKPADRKPKAPANTIVVTVRGVEIQIDRERLNDGELFVDLQLAKLLPEVEQAGVLTDAVASLLGVEETRALVRRWAKENGGRIGADETIEALSEIMTLIAEAGGPNS